MSSAMRLSLKAGEKIFINGAVLRADRKVGLELLNDATFLLEHHVMRPEETSTPLRQLYFMIQTMLIDPVAEREALAMCWQSLRLLRASFENAEILDGLTGVSNALNESRPFDALKIVRALLPIEAAIMTGHAATAGSKLEMTA